MGQVCAKHNEYYEDRCRWCEAPETDAMACQCAIPQPTTAGATHESACRWSGPIGQFRWLDNVVRAMTPPNDGHGIFE